MKSQFIVLALSSVFALNVSAQAQNGNMGAPAVNPAVCNQLVSQLRPQADNCIKMKDAAQRKQCFDQIGQSIQKVAPNGGCDQTLNPIKQEYIAKEKQMYPNQPSALNGPNGNQGPQGNMPQGNMAAPISPEICAKLIPQIRPQADMCLKVKDQAQRSQCFDKVGQSIQKVAPNGGCDQTLNPIKQEYMAKEKQMYPNQASALSGPNGNPGPQGNMPQGNMPQGNMPQGNMPQGGTAAPKPMSPPPAPAPIKK